MKGFGKIFQNSQGFVIYCTIRASIPFAIAPGTSVTRQQSPGARPHLRLDSDLLRRGCGRFMVTFEIRGSRSCLAGYAKPGTMAVSP